MSRLKALNQKGSNRLSRILKPAVVLTISICLYSCIKNKDLLNPALDFQIGDK